MKYSSWFQSPKITHCKLLQQAFSFFFYIQLAADCSFAAVAVNSWAAARRRDVTIIFPAN